MSDQGLTPTDRCRKFGCENAALAYDSDDGFWKCPMCSASYGRNPHPDCPPGGKKLAAIMSESRADELQAATSAGDIVQRATGIIHQFEAQTDIRVKRIARMSKKIAELEARSLPYSEETLYIRKDIHEERIKELEDNKEACIAAVIDITNVTEAEKIGFQSRIATLESDALKATMGAERQFNMWNEKLSDAGEKIAKLGAENNDYLRLVALCSGLVAGNNTIDDIRAELKHYVTT